MKTDITIEQRSKVNTTIGVVAGVVIISLAGFFVASLFRDGKKAATNLSLVTPSASDAQDTGNSVLPRGTIVTLDAGEKAAYARAAGGTITVQLTSTATVDPGENVCLQTFPNRANMVYTEYDANGTVVNTQNLSMGPCDLGWAVEIFKAGQPEAARATLTVPAL